MCLAVNHGDVRLGRHTTGRLREDSAIDLGPSVADRIFHEALQMLLVDCVGAAGPGVVDERSVEEYHFYT